MIDPRRALVIAEARTWIGTPYHHGQSVKGAGADCGFGPIGIYSGCQVIPALEVFARANRDHQELLIAIGIQVGNERPPIAVLDRMLKEARLIWPYPMDFAMHSDDEWYRRIVENFAHQVETPRPGDFVIWQWGRSYSHGGIVVDWPLIIHSWQRVGCVTEQRADEIPELCFIGKTGTPRPVLFYSPFDD